MQVQNFASAFTALIFVFPMIAAVVWECIDFILWKSYALGDGEESQARSCEDAYKNMNSAEYQPLAKNGHCIRHETSANVGNCFGENSAPAKKRRRRVRRGQKHRRMERDLEQFGRKLAVTIQILMRNFSNFHETLCIQN